MLTHTDWILFGPVPNCHRAEMIAEWTRVARSRPETWYTPLGVVHRLHKLEIDQLKCDAANHWGEPDFIWNGLLRSAATMGNARGIRLMQDRSLHERVQYAALYPLSNEGRSTALRRLFLQPK